MIMEKFLLFDRDWLILVFQVFVVDEIINYSIIMMVDEKNDYFKIVSIYIKIYDIFVYNYKELLLFIIVNLF